MTARAANLLAAETSPYLLQHADNPVHWRAWNEAALAEARTRNVPILLSIGYAACHWCHVMAHESFEDADTAALMNALFVNVKVDREERPDLDAIYQTALALLGEQGGWPLTMFLTPAGEPFWGGTYFPPAPRWGRPSFAQVLRGIAGAWADKPDTIAQNVAALSQALARHNARMPGGAIDARMADQVAERLAQEFDPVHGGLRGAPKFPQPTILELLWRSALRRRGTPEGDTLRRAVTVTLDRMCQGGIYDHLGGGFARYSTDPHWLVPHFEKMLYDNAALVELLTLVWQETRSTLYEARVAETVAWIEREMLAEDGAFAATLDADSEGVEGKFYVWTEAEIDRLLGPLAPRFKDAYDVRPGGNWHDDHGHGPEGEKTILNRSKRLLLGDAEHEGQLARGREILLRARGERPRPGWDDKVLADWNGLMVAALARAGFAFGRPEWIALARAGFGAARRLLTDGDGRLRHASRAGKQGALATLDDHANLIKGALALAELAGDADALAAARAWTDEVEARFADPDGGYYLTAADAGDLIVRIRHAHDNAVPAGNGTMVHNLVRLWLLTGDDGCRERAERTVAAFSGALARSVFPLSTLINGATFLERPVQVAIVGAPGAARAALLGAVAQTCVPDLVLQVLRGGAALPPSHPAHGKDAVGGAPAAYVCVGPVCSLPITDPAALRAALAEAEAPSVSAREPARPGSRS